MTARGVYSKEQRQDLEHVQRLMCRVARNVHWTGLEQALEYAIRQTGRVVWSVRWTGLEQALEYAVRAIHVLQVGLSRAWLHLGPSE